VPFYHVYGGTQDNNTVGGPSRTRTVHGIVNADWYIHDRGRRLPNGRRSQGPEHRLLGIPKRRPGPLRQVDGRADRHSPQPAAGDPPLRWNWDAPLIISPHAHTRLYFGAQRVFRSDDRGDTWKPVSGDLTRQNRP